MKKPRTHFLGPLGSEIHCLRGDAATVTAVAGLDWSRWFRRVGLDPLRGVISLMSPSPLHEEIGDLVRLVPRIAGDLLACAVEGLGGPRLRGEREPAGTGLEPDCAFYIGDRARAYLAAKKQGMAARDEFLLRVAPDLIVEVEVTHADEGKKERYRDLGAREFWRLRGRRSDGETTVSFHRLRAGVRPKEIESSEVLPGLTSEAVREAVEAAADSSQSLKKYIRVVTRIIQRHQPPSFRVEEERAEYRVGPADGPVPVPCDCSLHESGDFPRERFIHHFASHGETGGAAPEPPTSFVGPLGSEIHHLRADAATVAAVARVDWNRRFGRVCLDPARGVITLVSPSRLHEELGEGLREIVVSGAETMRLAVLALGGPRLRRGDEPVGTGMEPDCAFYLGERVAAGLEARKQGATAAEAFLERNGPDLVVEVEVTHADEGKMERYRDLGTREFWRVEGNREGGDLGVTFFHLRRGAPPKEVEASEALPGLTPQEVREAMDAAYRHGPPRDRRRAVADLVRRSRRPSVRGRQERAGNRAAPAASGGPVSVPCACSLHAGGADSSAGERAVS